MGYSLGLLSGPHDPSTQRVPVAPLPSPRTPTRRSRRSNLRARIGSWHDISTGRLRQPLQHDSYHRKLRKTDGDHGEGFVVGHQTAIASQPRECALDYPAAKQTLNPPSLSVRLTISSSTGNPSKVCLPLEM